MNAVTLHDLELPPAPLPDYVWWLLALVVLLLLAGGLQWWRKRQQPAAKALRKLAKLADDPASLPQLAAIVCEGLGGKSPLAPLLQRGEQEAGYDPASPFEKGGLRGIYLPFFQSLDHARFAPTPCSPEAFAALKREARTLLEQAR